MYRVKGFEGRVYGFWFWTCGFCTLARGLGLRGLLRVQGVASGSR